MLLDELHDLKQRTGHKRRRHLPYPEPAILKRVGVQEPFLHVLVHPHVETIVG